MQAHLEDFEDVPWGQRVQHDTCRAKLMCNSHQSWTTHVCTTVIVWLTSHVLARAVPQFHACYTLPGCRSRRNATPRALSDHGRHTSKMIISSIGYSVPTIVSARLLELPEEVLHARGRILDEDRSVTPVVQSSECFAAHLLELVRVADKVPGSSAGRTHSCAELMAT